MKLSVVTPSFGSGRFLAETLDSVAALRTPHEHVVIDGGSDDGTVELLRGRDDPSLAWVSEPDRGQTHAVNKGLDRASGDLCAWLNADDAYNPDAVDRAVALLAERPDVDVLYGGIQFTDEDLDGPPHVHPGGAELPPLPVLRRLHPDADVHLPPLAPRRQRAARRALGRRRRLRLLPAAACTAGACTVSPSRSSASGTTPDSKTGSDPMKAQDEALQIRLRWARNGRDRAIMQGFDSLKRAVLPRISGWPEPVRPAALRLADRPRGCSG